MICTVTQMQIGLATDQTENLTQDICIKISVLQFVGQAENSSVTLSSTEAEYVALSEVCQEAVWIQRLMEDFGEKVMQPTNA